MTPEGKVKAKIKKILKEHNIYYAMPHGAGYGDAGIPDFLCCMPPDGKFMAIEAKANGGQPTKLQEKNLDQIDARGGIPWIVDEINIDLFELWIKETAHDR